MKVSLSAKVPVTDNFTGTSAAAQKDEFIPVLRPRLPDTERLVPYLRQIDSSRIYSNFGPLSLELGCRLSSHLALPAGGVVCASSGTSALIGAILATGGRASDDRPIALLPAFTFVATAAAIELCGYDLVLADVDQDTWMLDPARLQSHPELARVGLVVPVSPFGRPVSQEPWLMFRERTGIPVVIDGAASLDCVVRSPDGHIGDIPVVLSFHATKSFSTGEGGAVATANAEVARRVTQAINFGFYGSRDCLLASTNGKMSEYHAAVGLAELDGWPEKLGALRSVADGYRSRLIAAGLRGRLFGAPDTSAAYAVFLCRDAAESEGVQESLKLGGVDFRLWYGTGLGGQTHFSNVPHEDLPTTEKLAPLLLGLPVAPDLSEADMDRVVGALVEGTEGVGTPAR